MAAAAVIDEQAQPTERAALPSSAVHKATAPEVETGEALYAKNQLTVGSPQVQRFVEAGPKHAVDALNVDLFFDRSYDERLRRMVEHVAQVEGPVLETVLARRIARAHGWQRTGARIQERVTAIAAKVLKATEEDVGTFFWHSSRGPEEPVHFRSGGEEPRGVEEVCLAELVALARVVCEEGKSGDSAVAAMAHALGLRHVRAANRNLLEKALELASRA